MKHQHGRESAGMIFIARFMNSFLHQASFATGYWCYDRHRSVRLVVLVGLAIDQIAQSGLSSLSVIYYSAQLFSLVRDNRPPSTAQSNEIHDVFISHASEDKDDFVRSLANSLISHGLNVWYDEMTLRIGDSLRQKIDKGLANSRVGLVVLSPAFISKGWTNYELDGIVTRAISGEQILLPIWHNITKQEVVDFSPSLADKVARSTATHTIDEIAHEIAELLHSRG